jgi:hypothetical protein
MQVYGSFFFFGRNFTKFRPEKYDFELFKRFSMEKMHKLTQFSRNKIKSRSPIFYDKFHKVVKNIELLSYLICSQIWLNHPMDDHHFSYITKLKNKPLVYGLSYSNMVMVLQVAYQNE